LPAISFSDLNENLKPLPAWRFFATLPTIEGNSALKGEKLSFLIESFTAPMVGVSFEDSPFNASTRQFPSARTLEQIQIQLVEDTSFTVLHYLRAWKDLIVNDRGDFGLPSKWKQNISIEPQDETGKKAGTLTWTGCGPTRIDALTFDGNSSRHVSINVTFVTDSMAP
jgi:hypothetical protein